MIGRRISSWWWDYLLIVGWLVVVFVVLGLPTLAGWVDLSAVWENRIAADVAITALTVLPWWVYLTVTESGARHATWGKRRAGLIVSRSRDPLTTGNVALRNLVKVLPWQLGHLGASRFATQPDVTVLAMIFTVTSLVLLVMVAGPPLVGRPGFHDRMAGTAVEEAGSPNIG